MLVIVASLLMGCTQRATYVTNTACEGFGVIKASRQDTTETLRQISVHNATYRAICEPQKEQNE